MTIRGSLKYKAWESDALGDTLEKVLWQKQAIQDICIDKGILPDKIGNIGVDADFFFEVLVAYEMLANTLMDFDLLSSGFPKQKYTVH